ncbi:caspase family protein [Actinomadura bangladeshensis]|uniref:vWA-MoxR associated protein C-terminal domain-containing protein n=1 Tax=Actinomadura bangladeshensis TaxID=453573 RepID=A0A6L9QY25_9ACTN|nr:caspase family protein [Actinomadura bangladeshensis]NEA28834.1 hypothetical protein [Actinomadura bangladeshensis]
MLNPAQTLVFSVGIERYGFGAELPGASAEAVRFARWALACGVPASRVLLACDGPGDAPPPGVQMVGTTREEIGKAVVGLAEHQGELLMVFWCGHGEVDERHRRILFTSDAVIDNLLNVSVDHLLSYLASQSLGTQFRRQFLLIDACANFIADRNLPVRAPIATFPEGRQREVEQFAYFSAAQGQQAQFNRTERHAVFSTTALGWLERNATSLPPDTGRLVQEVNQEFDRLRDASKLRHTPVYRRVRYEPGHEDVLSGMLPVSGTVQAGIRASGLTVAQVHRIACAMRGLRGVPQDLLERLAAGEAEHILASLAQQANGDAEHLAVRQAEDCLSRQRWITPALGGFGIVTLDQVRAAYHRAVPEGDTGLPGDLDEALDLAAAYGRRTKGHAPLHQMTAVLEHITGQRLDDAWYELPADRLAALRWSAAEVHTQTARLIVDLRAPGTALFDWPAEIVGHLLLPGRTWVQRPVACRASQTGARDGVNRLLDWAYEHTSAFTLGLIVPRAGLEAVPESWPYEDPLAAPVPLWHEHPTVLHCAERLSSRKALSGWRDRTTAIKTRLRNVQPEVQWLEPSDARTITLVVRHSTAACVGLGFPPGPLNGDLRQDPIIASIVGGAPYLMWSDQEPDDWAAAKAQLYRLTAAGTFEDLPARLHRLRRADPGGLGRSLRVIWDDPECLPPLTELVGPTTRGDNHA